MSLNIGIKGFKAAVGSLESAVGKGMKNCAICLLTLRFHWPDPEKSRPEPKPQSQDVLRARCEFCHSEYCLSLDGVPGEGRKVLRLKHSFTLEDEYTNPKAHAFKLWQEFSPENKVSRSAVNRRLVNNKCTSTRAKLQTKFDALIERKHHRLKAKYGERPFPEHKQLIESV